MKENGCYDYEFGPRGIGVWESHLGQFIHEGSKGQTCEDYEHERKVCQNGLVGFLNFFNIDYFHEKIEEEYDEAQY